MPKRIIIFDTTLRDGEQCPGASLTPQQKLEIAKQLARLGVDVIEGGFPIASPGDAQAVKAIAQMIKGPTIAALARSLPADIDAAAKALAPAKKKRIHVFLATSPIHRKFKLRKARAEILRQSVWAVKYAKKYCRDIEFSPEDASRTEPEFLYQVLEAVIAAGATTVNIPDTVGFAIPDEFGALIQGIGGALFEELRFDREKILNPRLSSYRVPRITDAPEVEVILVDRRDVPSAGAGESPITVVAPAIAGALFQATGQRVRSLPMLPQLRLQLMQGA